MFDALMDQPSVVCNLTWAVVNLSSSYEFDFLYYKNAMPLIKEMIGVYSIDQPESMETLTLIFWMTGNLAVDCPQMATMLIEAGLIKSLAAVYEKKLPFFDEPELRHEFSWCLMSLCKHFNTPGQLMITTRIQEECKDILTCLNDLFMTEHLGTPAATRALSSVLMIMDMERDKEAYDYIVCKETLDRAVSLLACAGKPESYMALELLVNMTCGDDWVAEEFIKQNGLEFLLVLIGSSGYDTKQKRNALHFCSNLALSNLDVLVTAFTAGLYQTLTGCFTDETTSLAYDAILMLGNMIETADELFIDQLFEENFIDKLYPFLKLEEDVKCTKLALEVLQKLLAKQHSNETNKWVPRL